MTDDRLPLAELMAKTGDGDFLRTIAESVLQIIMEADVDGLVGAGRHERSGERTTWRNGYRDRTLDTRLGKVPNLSAAAILDDGSPVLMARMAGATKTVWLTDPLAGDRFAAVTALAPGKGLGQPRRTVDLTLLPTAQGLAVETPTDDLKIDAAGDLVTLSRPRGLTLSPPSALLEAGDHDADAPRKAAHPALILDEWAQLGQAGFSDRYRRLQDAAGLETIAADGAPRAPIAARLALARFLVGSGLNYEAIGVLNALVDKAPNMLGEPEVRGLRGVARVGVGRLEEAQADFSGAALANDPATQVWRGYIAAEQGDWTEARRAFAAGAWASRAIAALMSPSWPGVTSKAMGRPCASQTAWILVVRPPRERPMPCSSAPLFRRPPSDAPWRWWSRAPESRRRAKPRAAPRTGVARRVGATIGSSDCRRSWQGRTRPGNRASDNPTARHGRCR